MPSADRGNGQRDAEQHHESDDGSRQRDERGYGVAEAVGGPEHEPREDPGAREGGHAD